MVPVLLYAWTGTLQSDPDEHTQRYADTKGN